jgi:ATP-dependent DNA helicase RecG
MVPGVNWIQKSLKEGAEYLIYGKVGYFNGEAQITHPEMELRSNEKLEGKIFLEPVYPSTEKIAGKRTWRRQIGKLTYTLFSLLKEKDIPENLPTSLLNKLKFPDRYSSFRQIHFPSDGNKFQQALRRLKFEEFFLAQLKMGLVKSERHRFSKGVKF